MYLAIISITFAPWEKVQYIDGNSSRVPRDIFVFVFRVAPNLHANVYIYTHECIDVSVHTLYIFCFTTVELHGVMIYESHLILIHCIYTWECVVVLWATTMSLSRDARHRPAIEILIKRLFFLAILFFVINSTLYSRCEEHARISMLENLYGAFRVEFYRKKCNNVENPSK